VLATIGTYGVLGFAVAQRRREIGVRMALGAMPNQIVRQFLLLGLRLLFLGMCFGGMGAWMTGRAMESILFDVPPLHLATLTGTLIVIAFASIGACLLPALRASRLQPMEALLSNDRPTRPTNGFCQRQLLKNLVFTAVAESVVALPHNRKSQI
jgi:ABC-type antimicrobial peptide transport system permease subunit